MPLRGVGAINAVSTKSHTTNSTNTGYISRGNQAVVEQADKANPTSINPNPWMQLANAAPVTTEYFHVYLRN